MVDPESQADALDRLGITQKMVEAGMGALGCHCALDEDFITAPDDVVRAVLIAALEVLEIEGRNRNGQLFVQPVDFFEAPFDRAPFLNGGKPQVLPNCTSHTEVRASQRVCPHCSRPIA